MLAAHSSQTPRSGRPPRAGHAYAHLKARILEGDIGPGARLSVLALAQALACSRVPLIEALKRLQIEGLVAANRELIARLGQKIQATLARVWGEDAPDAARSDAMGEVTESAHLDFDADQDLLRAAETPASDYSPT